MLSQALATTSPPYEASDAPVLALARAPLKPSKYGRCRVCQDFVLTFKRDFFFVLGMCVLEGIGIIVSEVLLSYAPRRKFFDQLHMAVVDTTAR